MSVLHRFSCSVYVHTYPDRVMHDKAAILPSYNREIPLLEEISLSRVFGNNDKMSHYISKEIIIV